jgi:hypothetical protein
MATASRKRRPTANTETILDRADELNTRFTNALGGPNCVSTSEATDINRAVELVLVAEADRRMASDAALRSFQSIEIAQVAIDELRLPGVAGRIFDRPEA